jgi:ubiquinone/menaquinone biosynthesis C-methylase UbiE
MSDDAGYDDIAEEYRRAKRLALFEVLEQTLLGAVGNLEGRSVLDLACGEGFNTRRLKMSGASRVVGVDISAEMIRLAQEEEVRAPLGIDYVCRSASDLGEIGTFDVVTAVFLLNYARSRDELRAMCDEIYRAVKPGQRFVSIADDGGRAALYPEAFRDYGFAYHAQLPMDDGAPMTLELRLDDEQWLAIDIRYYSQTTYEWALVQAGFAEIRWSGVVMPASLINEPRAGFWGSLTGHGPIALLQCRRPAHSLTSA